MMKNIGIWKDNGSGLFKSTSIIFILALMSASTENMLPSFAHCSRASLYCKGDTKLTSCALAIAKRKTLFALKRCASK